MLLDLCYLLALLFLSPWLLWRAATTGRYRQHLGCRLLGNYPGWKHDPRSTPTIWFHGVSVGEIHLLVPLIAAFRQHHPGWRIVVSATTESGLAEARRKFADLAVVPWPFDFTWSVRRALAQIQPRLVVLAESELWPNFLQAAHRRAVPICVVNGRLSPRTAARLNRFPALARRLLLQHIARFAVQSEAYAEQLRRFGVSNQRIVVTGSLKYDGALRHDPDAVRRLARWLGLTDTRYAQLLPYRELDQTGPIIWLAGSTHAPEEEIILRVFADLRRRHPRLHLLLVPRHPDRFETVWKMVTATGLSCLRRSRHTAPLPSLPSVVLWDTVGELHDAWGLADLGFVGGSLDGRRGGQSMIEPAAQGVPCLFGPHVWNFREAARQLVAAGGALQLHSAVELEPQLERLLRDPPRRQQMGLAAYRFVLSQQGAVRRTLQVLDTLISTRDSVAASATHTATIAAA